MSTKSIKEEIRRKQAELEAVESFETVFPGELPQPYLTVWHNSKLSDFGIIYKAETLEDAITLLNLWGGWGMLPLCYSKGLWTTFICSAHKEDNRKSRNVNVVESDVFPVTVSVSKYDVSFSFYVMIGTYLVSVKIEMKPSHLVAHTTWEVRGSVDYRRVEHQKLIAPAFAGYKSVKWVSGSVDHPSNYTLYWENASTLGEIFSEAFNG